MHGILSRRLAATVGGALLIVALLPGSVAATPIPIGGSAQNLVFVTQPGGGAAGAIWAQQPVVELVNQQGQLITGTSTVVTLSIGTNPAGGALTCTGTTTSVAAVGGYAYFTGCSISIGSASSYTLLASSAGWTAGTSSPFLVSGGGGSAQHLAFLVQPTGAAAGALWNVQVAVENASNVVVSDSSIIYLSIGTNPAGGVLTCTGTTTSVAAVGGYAYFTNCSISIGSASYYTLYATSSAGWTPVTSNQFLIGGAAATTPVTLTGASALGASSTSGFSTSTKIIKVGQSITIRVQSSPQLAGATLGVWIAIKGSSGTWGAYKPHTSVTMDSTGTAYYTYTFGSKAWLGFRLHYGGGTTYTPAWSYPSQFGRAM